MVWCFPGTTKGLCDPRSRFWFRWAPRSLILTLFLSVGWMVSLFFFMDDRIRSLENSMLAKALEESQTLTMAHCVLVGSSIPMLLDVILDFIELKLRKQATEEITLVHFRTRALLLFSSLVSTIAYASIRQFGNDADLRRLAFVYALSSYTAMITMLTTIMLPLMTLGIIPNTLLLAACILQFIGAPLKLMYLLNSSHVRLLQITNPILCISFFLFAVSFLVWGRDLWRRYKEPRGKPIQMGTTEFICIVYCCIFSLWALFSGLFYGRTGWRNASENNLWPVVVAQIVCVVPMTIIPGRISSADARSSLQLLSQKQAFVRFVSHEIRSPLSIVAAGLDMFVERLSPENTTTIALPTGPNTDPGQELLELANDLSEATDTAINTLNDLLQYESMDACMFKLEAARVEPADLFKAKSLGIIAKRHSLSLNVVPPTVEGGVFVLADVYRVEQVVRNLVTNACKFTPPGGTITISAEVLLTTSAAASASHRASRKHNVSNPLRRGVYPPATPTPLEKSVASFAAMRAVRCGSLRVKVSDTGVGIKEHNKDKLFRQFEQFDKNQLQSGGGSGLGLWISHFIVDCHGEKLQFESLGSGKGSVFFFDLPLFQQQEHEQQRQPITTTHPALMFECTHWPTNNIMEGQSPAAEGSLKEPATSGTGAKETGAAGTALDSHPRPHTMTLSRALSASVQISAPDGSLDFQSRSRTRGSESFDDGAGSATHEQVPKQVSFLLVDDSKGNRRMLRRMLESNKESILVSSIQEAEDGVDAVALVAGAGSAPDKPPIDCIFMDSVMKHMHGPETVRHLRGKLGFTGKIIGLTGNAMEDDVKYFQQSGLDHLLIKPLRKAGLIEVLVAHGLVAPAQPVLQSRPFPKPPMRVVRAAAVEDDTDGEAKGGEANNNKQNDDDRGVDSDIGAVCTGHRNPTAL